MSAALPAAPAGAPAAGQSVESAATSAARSYISASSRQRRQWWRLHLRPTLLCWTKTTVMQPLCHHIGNFSALHCTQRLVTARKHSLAFSMQPAPCPMRRCITQHVKSMQLGEPMAPEVACTPCPAASAATAKAAGMAAGTDVSDAARCTDHSNGSYGGRITAVGVSPGFCDSNRRCATTLLPMRRTTTSSKLRPETSSLLGSRPVSLAILPSTALRCSAAAHCGRQYRLHSQADRARR